MSREDQPTPAGSPRSAPLEWALAAALGAAALLMVGAGLASTPTDAALLEAAGASATPREQVRATHALVLRGYWEGRPLEELTEHLDGAAPEVREFVTRMHGSLLRPR